MIRMLTNGSTGGRPGECSSAAASQCKFILVSGGVISGIGKGLTASSIGVLMKSCGWRVTAIKIDPYLNIDAGTMSPAEHGEVFVLHDGGEVDLDLGNYERFLDTQLSSDNNITTGKIYQEVLTQERKGDYLGKTVQVVPHVTDSIKKRIIDVANRPNPVTGLPAQICVIELGGTVGDIESMPFVEALRQLQYDIGGDNFCSVFVSLVPTVGGEHSEQKTKPTQHGVKNLSSQGLSPHMIVCRSTEPLRDDVKAKLAMFCQVPPEGVIGVHDVSNTYNIPLMLQEQGVCNLLISNLKLIWKLPLRLSKWKAMAARLDDPDLPVVNIAIVGKYTLNSDAYLSIKRALQHACMALGYRLNAKLVESGNLKKPEMAKKVANGNGICAAMKNKGRNMKTPPGSPACEKAAHENAWEVLSNADGILVPGGFGNRGSEGKIRAVSYARETRKPYLGICLGMQMAVVEAAREVFQEPNAGSEEFDEHTPLAAVVFMPEGSTTKMGGTMRLGARETVIHDKNSMAAWLYGKTSIVERHRHRYEVNPDIVQELELKSDLRFIGKDTSGRRMEIVERENHPFFFGTQYHPEFESHPGRPSPVFIGFVMAAARMEITKKLVSEIMADVHTQYPWSDLPAHQQTRNYYNNIET